MLETLNILRISTFGIEHNSAAYIRILAEAISFAFNDKRNKVGDPAFVDVPLDALADKAYAEALAEKIRAGEKATLDRMNVDNRRCEPRFHAGRTRQRRHHDPHARRTLRRHHAGNRLHLKRLHEHLRPARRKSNVDRARQVLHELHVADDLFDDADPHIVIGAPVPPTFRRQCAIHRQYGRLRHVDVRAVSAPRIAITKNQVVEVSNRIPQFVTDEIEGMGYGLIRNYLSYAFAGVHGVKTANGGWQGGADPGATASLVSNPQHHGTIRTRHADCHPDPNQGSRRYDLSRRAYPPGAGRTRLRRHPAHAARLERYGIERPEILYSCNGHNEKRAVGRTLPLLADGYDVGLCSDAGMPGLGDPGQLLIQEVIAAGYEVDILPGPSAVTTALLAAGVKAAQFAFLGFLPQRKRASRNGSTPRAIPRCLREPASGRSAFDRGGRALRRTQGCSLFRVDQNSSEWNAMPCPNWQRITRRSTAAKRSLSSAVQTRYRNRTKSTASLPSGYSHSAARSCSRIAGNRALR